MSDFLAGVALLLLVIFSSIGLTSIIFTSNNIHLLSQCEKELPRNQHCKLIAMPEN